VDGHDPRRLTVSDHPSRPAVPDDAPVDAPDDAPDDVPDDGAHRVVVVGGGIGGLAAAVGLRRRGWDVTVLERAPRIRPVGAGLLLTANGLAGLDAIGVGDAVRAAGHAGAPGGTRTPSGRWLARLDADAALRLLGTAAVGIHRAELHRVMLDVLPPSSVVTGAEVLEVVAGSPALVRYRRDGRERTLTARVVIGADGIRSVVRRSLWPEAPAPVYSGATAWRGVTTTPWTGARATTVTWGRGTEFGMLPLGGGRVYWWAAVTAPRGWPAPGGDELAAVRARVAGWHPPIAAVLDATDPGAVVRTDLDHLATPLRSYVRGDVALVGDAAHAMTPNLGQGACQSIEDAVVLASVLGRHDDVGAALAEYDRVRRPRSQAVARAAHAMGRFGQALSNPVAVGARNGVMRLVPPAVALRSMSRWALWTAPEVPEVPQVPQVPVGG
jgi:2-polyprenyl-6-methoxyphenol hydroxylase-like FAD-dependent oxidoreductase